MGAESGFFIHGIARWNGNERSNVADKRKSFGGQFGSARDSEFEPDVAAAIELFGKQRYGGILV
jgi:hypothetical protein